MPPFYRENVKPVPIFKSPVKVKRSFSSPKTLLEIDSLLGPKGKRPPTGNPHNAVNQKLFDLFLISRDIPHPIKHYFNVLVNFPKKEGPAYRLYLNQKSMTKRGERLAYLTDGGAGRDIHGYYDYFNGLVEACAKRGMIEAVETGKVPRDVFERVFDRVQLLREHFRQLVEPMPNQETRPSG